MLLPESSGGESEMTRTHMGKNRPVTVTFYGTTWAIPASDSSKSPFISPTINRRGGEKNKNMARNN
jgi:hypothetical protein